VSDPPINDDPRQQSRAPLRSTLRRHGLSLFGHATIQLGGRIYTAVAQLGAFLLVGTLGSDRLVAVFALSMAAAGMVAMVMDSGTGLWVVRRIAAGDNLPRLHFPRMVALLISSLGLWGASAAGIIPLAVAPWVLITGAAMGCASLWRGVLWARLKYEREAAAAILQSTILVGGIALALRLEARGAAAPMIAAAVAYSLGYFARVGMARQLAQRGRELIGPMAWIKQVYSYAGQAVVTSAQTQADLLLLGALWAGPTAGVAAYGLSMRIYYSIGMPFEALGIAVLPRIALGRRIRWGRVLKAAVPGGIVLVVAMLVLTSAGTRFGLSPAASTYLKTIGLILTIALPFRFASYVLGAIVTGSGKQSSRFRAAAFGLATMLALDLWLIPGRGPYGAAAALVCADVVLMSGYAWASRQTFRVATP
jgi:O-antigen/teichoic acid export membrane protein